LLFLIVGVFIIKIWGEQELSFYNLWNSVKDTNLLRWILFLRILCLVGLPYIGGFFTKDLLMEFIVFNDVLIVIWVIFLVNLILRFMYVINILRGLIFINKSYSFNISMKESFVILIIYFFFLILIFNVKDFFDIYKLLGFSSLLKMEYYVLLFIFFVLWWNVFSIKSNIFIICNELMLNNNIKNISTLQINFKKMITVNIFWCENVNFLKRFNKMVDVFYLRVIFFSFLNFYVLLLFMNFFIG
jgi:hypothetical protein